MHHKLSGGVQKNVVVQTIFQSKLLHNNDQNLLLVGLVIACKPAAGLFAQYFSWVSSTLLNFNLDISRIYSKNNEMSRFCSCDRKGFTMLPDSHLYNFQRQLNSFLFR